MSLPVSIHFHELSLGMVLFSFTIPPTKRSPFNDPKREICDSNKMMRLMTQSVVLFKTRPNPNDHENSPLLSVGCEEVTIFPHEGAN